MAFFNWAAPLFGHFADRWSPEGVAEIAQWLRPFIDEDGDARGRLLDVGGGTGALAVRLSVVLGCDATVLDPTPEMLRYLPADSGVRRVEGVAEAMPFADDAFDALIVTDAFHHFRDQPGAVAEFARVVRPGGGVCVVELDPNGFLMRGVVVAEKLLGEPGAFFTPTQMCSFMAEHGMPGRCTRIRGVSYRFVGTVAH